MGNVQTMDWISSTLFQHFNYVIRSKEKRVIKTLKHVWMRKTSMDISWNLNALGQLICSNVCTSFTLNVVLLHRYVWTSLPTCSFMHFLITVNTTLQIYVTKKYTDVQNINYYICLLSLKTNKYLGNSRVDL